MDREREAQDTTTEVDKNINEIEANCLKSLELLHVSLTGLIRIIKGQAERGRLQNGRQPTQNLVS